MKKYSLLTTVLMVLALNINASELTIPNTFTANTPAVAAQVNANFAAVEVSVDDNDSRLDALEALVTQLQTDLATANSTISTLQADLTLVENNTVLQLDGFLQLAVIDGYNTAEFSGINVQVNDGSGDTPGAVNGLGNLHIGYGEGSILATYFCSDPQYIDSLSCTDNSGIWDNNVHTGSHNLVVGFGHSYTQYGSILLSERNVSNAAGTFVAGWGNLASGNLSSVSGGDRNIANGTASSISGGSFNNATGYASSITGGWNNTASGANSSISGGLGSDTIGFSSSVNGGQSNIATADYSSVSGGQNNVADGNSSSISGGQDNIASGAYSIVSGGRDNDANGEYSSVSGGRNNSANWQHASVSGGRDNSANAQYSSVSGGLNRTTVGIYDWIAGSLFQDD